MNLTRNVIGRPLANVVVLCAGLAIAVVSILFSGHGLMLIGLAAFFAIKGASRLPCTLSDVILGILAAGLVFLSKKPELGDKLRLSLQLGAILLTIAFLFSGLSLKSVIAEQRRTGG